jgi:hypothetical protein
MLHNKGHCQALVQMGLGTFWDTTYHHIRSRKQVPKNILVEPLVTIGHQAHQIHYLPPQTDG